MPPTEIRIDSLRVDLRGVPPDVARTALASLGPALQDALGPAVAGRSAIAGAHSAGITTPVVRLPADADGGTLRRILAAQLATSIATQLRPESRP